MDDYLNFSRLFTRTESAQFPGASTLATAVPTFPLHSMYTPPSLRTSAVHTRIVCTFAVSARSTEKIGRDACALTVAGKFPRVPPPPVDPAHGPAARSPVRDRSPRFSALRSADLDA